MDLWRKAKILYRLQEDKGEGVGAGDCTHMHKQTQTHTHTHVHAAPRLVQDWQGKNRLYEFKI